MLPVSQRCPVCAADLGPENPSYACPSCEMVQHRECREYLGGCARFGCRDSGRPEGAITEYREARLTEEAVRYREMGRSLAVSSVMALLFAHGKGLVTAPWLAVSALAMGLAALYTVIGAGLRTDRSSPSAGEAGLGDRLLSRSPVEEVWSFADARMVQVVGALGMGASLFQLTTPAGAFLGFWVSAFFIGLGHIKERLIPVQARRDRLAGGLPARVTGGTVDFGTLQLAGSRGLMELEEPPHLSSTMLARLEQVGSDLGHSVVCREHLLMVLLEDGEVQQHVTALGGDASMLTEELILHLRRDFRPTIFDRFRSRFTGRLEGRRWSWGLGRLLERTVAQRQASGQRDVRPVHLMASILEDGCFATQLLSRDGFSRWGLLMRVSHPDRAGEAPIADCGDGPHDVVIHNDDYTTMEFVVEILREVFEKTTPEAMRIMLAVHSKGSGLVGTYEGEDAASRAGEVLARARRQGFPLALSCDRSPRAAKAARRATSDRGHAKFVLEPAG